MRLFCGGTVLGNFGDGLEDDFDACATEEIDAVGETILTGVDDALDAALDDELGTLDAGAVGDVESGAIARIMALGDLGDGIGFGMENVGLGTIVVGLAIVFEACGRAVVAVADDHLFLDDETTYLTTLAVGVFGPDGGHAQIAVIEKFLFGGHGRGFLEQPKMAADVNTKDGAWMGATRINGERWLFVEELEAFEVGLVATVELLVEVVFVLALAHDVGDDETLHLGTAALQFASCGTAYLWRCEVDEGIEESLAFEITLQRLEILVGSDDVAMIVAVLEGKRIHQADGLVVVSRDVGGVAGYEVVGHDATTAIDCASAQGCIDERIDKVDGVLVVELATLVAIDEVHLIVLALPHRIRLLDAAAGWGVIASDGKAQGRTIVKVELLLYETLAERTTTDNLGTVVVLHGSSKDFGG